MNKIQNSENSVKDGAAVRKSTSDGLQRIYLIIVGLAITEALRRSLTDQTAPLAHWTTILLLGAFLVTVIRFAHGSILHLTALTGETKWLWDMFILLFQAILFFTIALHTTSTQISLFLVFFFIVLAIDSLWLINLKRLGHLTKMERQWLISNTTFSVFFGMLYWFHLSKYLGLWNDIVTAAMATIAAFVAAFLDYCVNKNEYFPK